MGLNKIRTCHRSKHTPFQDEYSLFGKIPYLLFLEFPETDVRPRNIFCCAQVVSWQTMAYTMFFPSSGNLRKNGKTRPTCIARLIQWQFKSINYTKYSRVHYPFHPCFGYL